MMEKEGKRKDSVMTRESCINLKTRDEGIEKEIWEICEREWGKVKISKKKTLYIY